MKVASTTNTLQGVPGATAAKLPADVSLQLATLAPSCPSGERWIHEIKLDGYRLLATVKGKDATLTTRNGNDWTSRFANLTAALVNLPCKAAMLDGEAVVLTDAGVSSFQKLQNALGHGPSANVIFFAFDLLYLDGFDLRECPLLRRKEVLAKLLKGSDASATIRYSDHVQGGGEVFNKEACRMGLEGTICKLADAPYVAGRSRAWLKVKCLQRQEFVIVGYTDPAGARKGLGALLLGVYDEGKLIYCGKVGTGFSATTLRDLYALLAPLECSKPVIVNAPKAGKGVHWVAPTEVAEVTFAEWTEDGAVRHPSFQGLRLDKDATEIVREKATEAPAPVLKVAKPIVKGGKSVVAGIPISHPEKILYADVGVTKMDLALYYQRIEHLVVPYLRNRPLTLLRCPDGFDKNCFFQKHGNEMVPKSVPRVMVKESLEGQKMYLMVDALPSLIQLVQLGVLEFHVWGSRAERLETPDIVVFDLDPGPAVAWKDVVTTALVLRERLAELGLNSYARFTGGKGIHVVVPLTPKASWDDVKNFSLAVAEEFVRKAPRTFTANLAKQGREGKILIDYLRNARNATAVASYSARARPGAPVALPVRWQDIESSNKGPFLLSVKDAPAWLEKLGDDPWLGFEPARKALTKAIMKKLGLS